MVDKLRFERYAFNEPLDLDANETWREIDVDHELGMVTVAIGYNPDEPTKGVA